MNFVRVRDFAMYSQWKDFILKWMMGIKPIPYCIGISKQFLCILFIALAIYFNFIDCTLLETWKTQSAQRALRYNVPKECLALSDVSSWRQMRNVEYKHRASKSGNQWINILYQTNSTWRWGFEVVFRWYFRHVTFRRQPHWLKNRISFSSHYDKSKVVSIETTLDQAPQQWVSWLEIIQGQSFDHQHVLYCPWARHLSVSGCCWSEEQIARLTSDQGSH